MKKQAIPVRKDTSINSGTRIRKWAVETTTVAPAQPPQIQIKPTLRFKPRAAGDDLDVQSTPSRLTFKLDFESESAKDLRASTPTGASHVSPKARNLGRWCHGLIIVNGHGKSLP